MRLPRRGFVVGSAASVATGRARAAAAPGLRIGVLADLSGVYRDLSGPVSVACVRQAVEEFDPSSHGFTVDVLSADHQNKSDVAVEIVRHWIDRDGVDLVIDCPNSAVALAVAGVCREKDRVFIDSPAATADLTGPACAPTTLHWAMDTWMLAHSTGGALVRQGGSSWFFITADYAFGTALERDASALVTRAGGRVLGGVRAPLKTADFSSYLLQAQSSGAKVVALCNAGQDTVNAVKQAHEFGLTSNGTKLAGLLVFISDIHAIGLATARGLILTESFYWDLNDRTRAFSKRLQPKIGELRAGMGQAGSYSGALHYLKAAAGMGVAQARASGAATVLKMKSMPTDDDAFGRGSIREDGRVLHPAYLFQVKTAEESRGPWDYYRLLATTPSDRAFRPLADGHCPMVKT